MTVCGSDGLSEGVGVVVEKADLDKEGGGVGKGGRSRRLLSTRAVHLVYGRGSCFLCYFYVVRLAEDFPKTLEEKYFG
ncbi:hypothetical protein ACOMHN_048835 [Nucella lapillus]